MCLWCVAAEPRHNVYPAVVGAAIGGMLFAAIVTVLLLVFIIRNRHNNPRESEQASGGFVSDLALTLCVFFHQGYMICCLVCEYLRGTMRVYTGVIGALCETKHQEKNFSPPFVASRQHSQSRENINFPEDEIVGASEGQLGDSGGGKTIPVLTLFLFYALLKKIQLCSFSSVLVLSLQVPLWFYPGLLLLSPSHPRVPPPPPAKPLPPRMMMNGWMSPSLLRQQDRSDPQYIVQWMPLMEVEELKHVCPG